MPSNSSAAFINDVSRWLNYFGAIPMIILGIIGSFLTIVVFTKKKSFRRNPTITYLLASAVLTGIHLPTIYSQSILVDGFLLGIFNTNDIACREHNYLLYVTTVAAISFPCWAAFDQYASTCRQALFRQRWHSMKFVRGAIVSTVVFWTIVYLPLILYSGVVNNRCVVVNVFYRKFLNYFFTPLVYAILPFVLIVFCAAGTIRNLRERVVVSRRTRLMKQIRRMLIPQLIILGISGFPFSIQVIYQELTIDVEKNEVRRAIEHLFVQIDRLFYHCNFVCTFYIYVYVSRDVRKVLKRLFNRWVLESLVAFNGSSRDTSLALQALI